jgi:hypothetical protein
MSRTRASALAESASRRLVPVTEVRGGVPVTSQGARATALGGRARLVPSPGSRGRGAAGARTAAADTDPVATDPVAASDGNLNQYRLSELPADVVAEVSVAAALSAPRQTSKTMQVVEIASTIAGVAMTRVVDNDGDVRWELDQMPRDAVHPGAASASPSSAAWQSTTIQLPGLRCENYAGQETFADFEVTFKHNGASLGYIEVTPTKVGDAWTWGLTVKETMTADPRVYDTSPSSGARFGAVKLRFHFRFDHAPADDVLGYIDLTLYGNGSYAESTRWTQP